MYLGLDLGTSGVKALLIDEAQNPVGAAHGELDVSRPHPGWSEQDPAQWIKACRTAIEPCARRTRRNFPPLPVSAFPGRCMAQPCWTPRTAYCAPHSLERYAQLSRSSRTGCRPRISRHHRQYRLSQLHRTETCLDRTQRSRYFRPHPQGFTAERLSASLARRRIYLRHVGFGGHKLARYRCAPRSWRLWPRPAWAKGRCRNWSRGARLRMSARRACRRMEPSPHR